jgi:hypothetical protein
MLWKKDFSRRQADDESAASTHRPAFPPLSTALINPVYRLLDPHLSQTLDQFSREFSLLNFLRTRCLPT